MSAPDSEDLARSRAVAALVPHVVHTIHNHLAVVLGTLDVVLCDERDSARVRQLQLVESETRRSIEHLRRLSELAVERTHPRAIVELGPTLRMVEMLLEPSARAARHAFELRLPLDPLGVYADEPRLVLALVALGLDAVGGPLADRVRLSARGPGRVRLGARSDERHVIVSLSSVRDAPAAVVVPSETIGDDVVATIASEHAASFRRRHLGAATCAQLRFDAVRRSGGGAPAAAAAPPRSAAAPPSRVLVLDPDAPIAELVGQVLRERGYRVRAISTPQEALAALHDGPWDVILCDAHLIGPVAPQVPLDTLRAAGVLIPMSAAPHPQLDALTTQPALRKPFRPATLIARVAAATTPQEGDANPPAAP